MPQGAGLLLIKSHIAPKAMQIPIIFHDHAGFLGCSVCMNVENTRVIYYI